MPDEKYGEELWPGCGCATGAEPLTAEALREFCTGKLAHYKIPRYVQVVDEFPMTVTGKIRKVEMRERSVDSSASTPPTAAPPARRRPSRLLPGVDHVHQAYGRFAMPARLASA